MNLKKGKEVARFTDKYGEERIIQYNQNCDLVIKNSPNTVFRELSIAVAPFIAERIKEERIKKGMTLKELGEASGFGWANPKQRMYEIENAAKHQKSRKKNPAGNGYGIKIGTLYSIAYALNVEPYELIPPLKKLNGVFGKYKRTIKALSPKV